MNAIQSMHVARFVSAWPCLLFFMLAGTAHEAWAFSLAGNDNWADCRLIGQSSENILASGTNPRVFSWNDADGNGTPGDSVSAGFDLGGYNISPSNGVSSASLTLDLFNGTGPGAITNSGAGGQGDIVTRPGQDYNFSTGLLTITNATHITIRNLDLRGESGGGATITHAGNFTVTASVLDHHRDSIGTNNRRFLLDGGGIGSLNVSNGISRVVQGQADFIITNYTSVVVNGYAAYDKANIGNAGDYGINAGAALGGGDNASGRVIVAGIGSGGIAIPYGVSTFHCRNSINRTIALQTTGSVNVGRLNSSNSSWFSGKSGGNILITAGGDITVTGTINANNNYADSGDGILSLTATGALATITVADLDCNTFRMSTSYDTFSAGSRTSTITGTLANFDYTTPTSSQIRAQTGQTVYYDPTLAGNAYLSGATYTLSGGGLLKAIQAQGTVIMFR